MSPLLSPYNSFGSLVNPTAITVPVGTTFYPAPEQAPGWLDVGMWDSTIVFFDPNNASSVTVTAQFTDNSLLPNTAIPVRLLRNTIGPPWVFRFRNYLPFMRFQLVNVGAGPVTVNMAVSTSNRPALYEQPYSAVSAGIQLTTSRAMGAGATAVDAAPHYMGPALFSLMVASGPFGAQDAAAFITTHTGGLLLYRFDVGPTKPSVTGQIWLPGEEVDITTYNAGTPQTVATSLIAAS